VRLRLPEATIGWRVRALAAAALLFSLAIFGFTRWLAAAPHVQAVPAEALAASAAGARDLDLPALTARPGPRWQTDAAMRARQLGAARRFEEAFAARSPLEFRLQDGSTTRARIEPRGYGALGLLYWPLAALALVLALVGSAVWLARAHRVNALYALLAFAQAAALLWLSATTLPGVGVPSALLALDTPVRFALDALTAAAALHAFALWPHRPRQVRALAWAGWAAAGLLTAYVAAAPSGGHWWVAQCGVTLLGAAALAVAWSGLSGSTHPLAAVLARLGSLALGSWLLVTLAVTVAQPWAAVADGAIVVWHLFFASLLVLAPFVARSKQLLREFALLAGVSTVAASLDLLFVSVFSLPAFASLAIVVFVALALYAGARQWLMNRLIGASVVTTERIFERLYRAAREVQARPGRRVAVVGDLLRELFEPLEIGTARRSPPHAEVAGGGTTLIVPLPGPQARDPGAFVLRFARRGNRIFTAEDAQLAERALDQLGRAVAYDIAVERGRQEERQRIAEDLHDDIGARLLTLMYRAPNPEIEDYLRYTLKDLKTITRGLAAGEQRLSHALAEWKADVTQRLTAAHVELDWQARFDRDGWLTTVQWSALTRVLRELISNTLHHAQASKVAVQFVVDAGALRLVVSDDGEGRAPASWAHGLGLGGVRKRMKLLGGEVAWRENSPRGIVCEVKVARFALRD
jgi:signal transduction histidine kinase